MKLQTPFLAVLLALAPLSARAADAPPLQISGVYPHLCAYNKNGECGIGGVVPWAGKLWYNTYPPHFRTGSDDSLYEVDPATMALTVRPDSVGGTHANRLIHRESNQLIIGPYFIDDKGTVRAVDVKKMPGRYTANARHLTDPANKVYFVDMEGPVWEVDVKTLEARRLFAKPVPGWHSKGAYSGQGVLVVSNNGESASSFGEGKAEFDLKGEKKGVEDAGVLAEWNGKGAEGWKIISRRQHVEVTGPGGLNGNANDTDPIWSTGWDKRSVMLHVRDAKDGAWHLYRLPKGSHTYDPKHGWYTEWPRIREVVPAADGKPAKWVMTMHGQMYDFPATFSAGHTAGIRPINTYLRYVPDLCGFKGQVVLSSDDTSIMQNPMAGVSQSNLWFGKFEQLADFGPAAGWGGVWLGDSVKANEPSDPYLLAGFEKRILHLAHKQAEEVTFTLEVDEKGDGTWKARETVKVPANGYVAHVLPKDFSGEWIRIKADKSFTGSAYFHYLTPSKYTGPRDPMFASIATHSADTNQPGAVMGGLIRPGKDRQLQFLAQAGGALVKGAREVYYEVDDKLAFNIVDDAAKVAEMHKLLDPQAIATADAASIIITTKDGRLRLPRGNAEFSELPAARQIRELESERNLVNVGGTFFEAPRSTENSGGKAEWKNLKPIASHNLAITDYCTWRGLLVIAGTADNKPDGHYFKSAQGNAGLWFGAIDDLWKLGKPVGVGGPWKDSAIKPGEISDPYLMTNYDKKTLTFTHDAKEAVNVTIEVDPTNTGVWKKFQTIQAAPGSTKYVFPDGFGAYWVRLSADKPCTATAVFVYE